MTRVTPANLEAVRARLPLDQRADLEPGCITWPAREGAMTAYPRSGRVAISRGGTSDWGEYTGDPADDSFRVHLDGDTLVGLITSEGTRA